MNRTRQSKLSRRKSKQNIIAAEPQTHPALLNDIVLQNIFKYLGFYDLKSCRKVKNRIWLQNSNKAWWSRTKVRFADDFDTPERIETYIFQTDINSHATNYKFEGFGDDFHGFWEHLGHSVKSLELSDCNFDSVDSFRQILYRKCPNLEKLVVAEVHINNYLEVAQPTTWEEPRFGEQKNLKVLKLDFCGDAMPMSWVEILSHFPNLEVFKAHSDEDIYKAISVIRQHDPKKLKLRHIKVNILSEDSCRSVLLDPNLKLESIHITDKTCRPETLVDILDLHAKSLKRLSFGGQTSRNRRCDPVELSLRQPLLSLEKLKIVCCLFTEEIFKFTPNLRKVRLNYDGAYNLLKSFDPNLRIDTCKELRVTTYGRLKNSPKSDLQFFLSVFPNVEILTIDGHDNSKFSMICEGWPNLKTFIVHSHSQVDDFGLLGFDPNSKSKTARVPNITNLKALQLFSLSAHRTRRRRNAGKAKNVRIEMKNGDVVLRELEKLTDLKTFELTDYELKEESVWKQIFDKYGCVF